MICSAASVIARTWVAWASEAIVRSIGWPRRIPRSIRQDQPPVFREGHARRLHDLPNMAVRIGEVSAIAAVVGRLRLAQWLRTGRHGLGESRIDLGGRRAIPRQRRAAKGLRPAAPPSEAR